MMRQYQLRCPVYPLPAPAAAEMLPAQPVLSVAPVLKDLRVLLLLLGLWWTQLVCPAVSGQQVLRLLQLLLLAPPPRPPPP
jgi:hypothetical protein